MRLDQLSVGEIWLCLRRTDPDGCAEQQATLARSIQKRLYPTPRTPKRDAGGRFSSKAAADAAWAEEEHARKHPPQSGFDA